VITSIIAKNTRRFGLQLPLETNPLKSGVTDIRSITSFHMLLKKPGFKFVCPEPLFENETNGNETKNENNCGSRRRALEAPPVTKLSPVRSARLAGSAKQKRAAPKSKCRLWAAPLGNVPKTAPPPQLRPYATFRNLETLQHFLAMADKDMAVLKTAV
jgi:hypothetical protein